MRSAGAISRRQAGQTLGFQDAGARVTVQVGQEVADHKGEVIQRKAGGPPQRAHKGPLFVRGLPGQLVRPAGAVLTVGRTAAYATCGLSRSTRYSAEPGLRL